QAPFSVSNLPEVGGALAPGAQASITVTFMPTAAGSFSESLAIGSTGGALTIFLAGSAGDPQTLAVMPASLSFGTIAPGATAELGFTIANAGGSNLTITKSKPPAHGVFVPRSTLDEGTTI